MLGKDIAQLLIALIPGVLRATGHRREATIMDALGPVLGSATARVFQELSERDYGEGDPMPGLRDALNAANEDIDRALKAKLDELEK